MSLPAELEEGQRLIDKIASEESLAAVLALNYQRNCFASTSQLPPEILSRIFSFVKLSCRANSLAWINITHVSTHWRSVAIDSPTLWDEPPLGNGQWMVEMLQRSKTVGLTISTDLTTRSPQRKMDGFKEILQHHGARIQHLTLTRMTFKSWAVLEDLPVSTPRLETLCLSSLPGRASWEAFRIPNAVLSNSVNLRQLELSGCNVHWHCFPLSNITHLKLHEIEYTARPTWTQFIDALAKMSKLKSLDLNSILDPTVKLAADPSSAVAQLSCLQRLIVESPTTEIEMFFGHVAFPPSATVHVRVIPQSHSISEISAVISSIARLYSGHEFLTLSLRDTGSDNVAFIAFKLFRKVFERPNDIYADTPVAALTLELVTSGGWQVTAGQIVQEIFNNGLPLDKVSHAELNAETNPITLARTLGSLPALSFVQTGWRGGAPFVDALYPYRNAVDAEHFPLYFKNLVSIHLSVTFKSKDVDAERSPSDVSLKQLQDCLIQRYECGAEIQKLSLDDRCHTNKLDVLDLRNIVVDVNWDGMEQEEEEYDDEPNRSFAGNTILRADGSIDYANSLPLSWS